MNKDFYQRLLDFRKASELSRAAFASCLGVSQSTIQRWESGASKPSKEMAKKLASMGFGGMSSLDTNENTIPILTQIAPTKDTSSHAHRLKESSKITVDIDGQQRVILPAPFVRNGPPDQSIFHKQLIEMQASSIDSGDESRLSLVESIDSLTTLQHLLDNPKPTAVSWNSNYGSHGWHRYVGKFPPHVVRALLNYFKASSDSVVCDPFSGSGTTAVECRLLGIPFVGIEICPLSCLISRTKACFPNDVALCDTLADDFVEFYWPKWEQFLDGRDVKAVSYNEVLRRTGNLIPRFANLEKWFNVEALLGLSIAVEYGMSLDGYKRDALLLAVSSKMRSFGNVDVDVVRAEFRKQPRKNVDVCRHVKNQLKKMACDIKSSFDTHQDYIGSAEQVVLHEESVLDVDLGAESVDCIITSPPYGTEAISYLRTHLLSYRTLVSYLQHDPYETRDKTIGSEYLSVGDIELKNKFLTLSKTARNFFTSCDDDKSKKFQQRRLSMMKFVDDMLSLGEKMASWLKGGGHLAYIIGNKKLGNHIIPMDKIITEIFEHCGLTLVKSIRHKLKTNNSNSQVPWQERIIQEEYLLIFERKRRS